MMFIRFYEPGTDRVLQSPVSDETGAKVAALGHLVTPLPMSDVPVVSRLRSERHLKWTTPEEWTGTL